jgi:hypothetical protein
MTHFEDDMLPPVHKFAEAAELVTLGRDQACKDIWDDVQEVVKLCNHGPVVKLNDLYRILFRESER